MTRVDVEPTRASQLLGKAFADRGAQTACARRTGISQAYLSQLANAERYPSLRVQKVLAEDDVKIPRPAWGQPPRATAGDAA